MFTGIVQALCEVVGLQDLDGIRRLSVDIGDLAQGLENGASVANNGTCLTVVKCSQGIASFDVIAETLALTNLGSLKIGDTVNIERSLKFGDELGGHILSGHVSGTIEVSRIEAEGASRKVWFEVPAIHMRYLMWKGWIAIDGASLTISGLNKESNMVAVSLIPETLQRTTLGSFVIGSRANLEVDAQTQTIVNTVHEALRDPNLRELIQDK